jgi:hypothetical protein
MLATFSISPQEEMNNATAPVIVLQTPVFIRNAPLHIHLHADSMQPGGQQWG